MSIRIGNPKNIDSVISTIREDDKLFYRIFARVEKDKPKEAYKIIRDKFEYSFMDARMVIHRIKNIYDQKQIINLLKYIEKHNPEYMI